MCRSFWIQRAKVRSRILIHSLSSDHHHPSSADVPSFVHENYWCYPLSVTILDSPPACSNLIFHLFFYPKMTAMRSINSMKISVVLITGCHSDNSRSWNFNLLNSYRRGLKKSALLSLAPERCLSILQVKVPRISTHLITLLGAKCFLNEQLFFAIQLKIISCFLSLLKDGLCHWPACVMSGNQQWVLLQLFL